MDVKKIKKALKGLKLNTLHQAGAIKMDDKGLKDVGANMEV
jgi:hypothetical protein